MTDSEDGVDDHRHGHLLRDCSGNIQRVYFALDAWMPCDAASVELQAA